MISNELVALASMSIWMRSGAAYSPTMGRLIATFMPGASTCRSIIPANRAETRRSMATPLAPSSAIGSVKVGVATLGTPGVAVGGETGSDAVEAAPLVEIVGVGV